VPELEAGASDPRPMRHCYKCGREIGPDESMCEVCNRAGMATPSASQYHGTMVVAIIAGVVGLAIWGSLALRGVGPYQAEVLNFSDSPPNGVEVSVGIENLGTSRGFAKCQLRAYDAGGRQLGAGSLVAGPLDGGESGTFSNRISGLLGTPATIEASCR
jgi:predicted nucleic acid-binding Zn ribbon protein